MEVEDNNQTSQAVYPRTTVRAVSVLSHLVLALLTSLFRASMYRNGTFNREFLIKFLVLINVEQSKNSSNKKAKVITNSVTD